MKNVTINVHPRFVVGVTDKRLFGSFIEHLGRAVYGGIYEPSHPTADENGFRGDVKEAIRELSVPLIRYPGGNFVSGYRWRDGIGPKDKRPRRVDLAWRTVETNQCGTDDFCDFCRSVGAEPLMTVNLGTAGINEARELVEYCNLPSGTALSDLRVENGYTEPHTIRTWCLGNEMDGDWQIGHKEAHEYGRLAAETSKIMKMTSPGIETVLCGSSAPYLATFPQWEAEVLEAAYPHVDYISLHRYWNNNEKDTPSFVASPVEAEAYIKSVIAVCDYMKAKKRSDKTIGLSFDEWNVWRHESDTPRKDWEIAPPLLEETYLMEDALVAGGFLITLLRHCDRVKIACLAQLVNVIAPIMTETGGGLWKQSIFYPFRDVSTLGRGTVYDIRIDGPRYECRFGEVSTVDGAAVANGEGQIVLFLVNRSLDVALPLSCDLSAFGVTKAYHRALTADSPYAGNSMAEPDRVVPHDCETPILKNGCLSCTLPAFSFNTVILS